MLCICITLFWKYGYSSFVCGQHKQPDCKWGGLPARNDGNILLATLFQQLTQCGAMLCKASTCMYWLYIRWHRKRNMFEFIIVWPDDPGCIQTSCIFHRDLSFLPSIRINHLMCCLTFIRASACHASLWPSLIVLYICTCFQIVFWSIL